MTQFDPPGYRYPILAQPLTPLELREELDALLEACGLDPDRATMSFPVDLDLEHWSNPRRYAQVIVKLMHFQFARAMLWLPDAQRVGVLAHEVGHVLTPGGNEADADRAAGEILGIPLKYDHRWPGKGLQTAITLEPGTMFAR